jgi:hypothetical protein
MNEPAHGVGTDKAENPENNQNDCNGLEHRGSPCVTA